MRWLAAALLALWVPAQAAYLCMPKEIGGSGTYYRLTSTDAARALQWVCIDPTGKPVIQGPAWRKDFAPSAACAAALPSASLTGIPDLVVLANAAVAACETTPVGADGRVVDPVVDAARQAGITSIREAWAADHPPAGPVYKVPSGGSAVYPVVNGKLGLYIAGKRAPGGALCDLAKLKVVSGAYTYAAYEASAPNEVALCLKVGP